MLLEGIASLLLGVNKVRDPDKEKREALLAEMRSNPKLVQQYKDLDNPALIDQLQGRSPRFGSRDTRVADLLNKIDYSPEAKMRRDYSDLETKEKGGILETPDAERLENYRKQLYGTPTRRDRELQELDIERTRTSIAQAKSGIETDQVQRKAAELNISESQTKLEELRKQAEAKKIADNAVARIGGAARLARAFEDGKSLSPEEQNAIINTPSYASELEKQRNNSFQRRQLAINELLASRKGDTQALMQQKLMDAAKHLSEFSRGVISVQDAFELQSNPELASQLMNSKEKPTDPRQARLWQAAQEQKRLNSLRGKSADRDLLKAVFDDLMEARKGISKGDISKGDIDNIVNELNVHAAQSMAGTGKRPPRWGTYIDRKATPDKKRIGLVDPGDVDVDVLGENVVKAEAPKVSIADNVDYAELVRLTKDLADTEVARLLSVQQNIKGSDLEEVMKRYRAAKGKK